ncbi:MAG: PAS domain S-box protein [Bacteroidales bacterium]|nr:PAS domain S-box protein [Bacteroidales bacterium]MBN2758792.1 PAS domain S-box protein [Bacteroidales bacterium]
MTNQDQKIQKRTIDSIYDEEYGASMIKIYSINRITLLAVLFGFTFPLFAWFFDIVFNNYPFSIKGIIEMHLKSPLHFIVDTSPIVIGFIVNFIYNKTAKRRKYLQRIILQRNNIIQKNSELAEKIGEGHFDVDTEYIDERDKLGNSLLLMLQNLKENTERETQQNWIAKGKEIVGNVLRLHNNINELAYETLVSLIKFTNTIQGAFYIYDDNKGKLVNIATYGYNRKKFVNQEFNIGQGLVGQAAFERDIIYRNEIPESYSTITSGIIGEKKPSSIIITPLISDDKLQGVIELASIYDEIYEKAISLIKELSPVIAQTLFNLKVNTRTENLLRESQKLTDELRKNEEVLRSNAKSMEEGQTDLQKSNRQLASQMEEVEKGQKRLHSLLENASEVISIYDRKGIVKYVSPSVSRILGYAPEEMIGTNRFERGESILMNAFNELLEDPKKTKTFEYRYEKKNHGIIWLETTGRNLLKNAAINGIVFNTRDITVRKVADEAQKMSGEMQALSENSPDMIIRLNPEGKFFYANPIVEKFTGIPRTRLKQKKISDIEFEPEFTKFFLKGVEDVKDTKIKYESEITLPTVDGEKIMQVNVIPELNKNNEIETILFVAHDITDRKQIEIEIEKKNKDITESINYAQRIQSAIIPDIKLIKQFLPNSFIFYKPKDVVSGDFPWFFQKGDNIYLAVVDCTGHGVPGALLSFIGYFILNSIVDHDQILTAGNVLDKLHSGVRQTLKQEDDDASARDGMDIALCVINNKKKTIQFAGAHRPLFYMSNGELEQFKGNSKAIGGIPPRRKTEDNFTNYIINYKPGDRIYFFSDGLPDQIGGDAGRKYQARRIREIVVKFNEKSINDVGEFFKEDFNEWKGDQKQIDDILLIGIEF